MTPSGPGRGDKIREVWDRLEVGERLAGRQRTRSGPGLVTIMVPLWIWALGAVFLPDATPLFARALFHASCWGGFAWLAFQAWRNAKSPASMGPPAPPSRPMVIDEKAQRRRQFRDMDL